MTFTLPGSSPRFLLLPKEHGAYVQLGVALTSGLVLGHGYLQAWGQALLTALAFLAGEPVLILLGYRGSNTQSAVKTRAIGLLILLGGLGLLSAVSVWWQAPLAHWRSLLIPIVLASALMALALAKREHTTLGELVAAWALASSAYPIAILGGAGAREAGQLALVLVGIQSIGTMTVRAFLESRKRSGLPLPRAIPLFLGMALVGLGFASELPYSWIIALAMVPNTAIAAWMLMSPPSPRHMKRLGWLLTGASMVGVLPVLLALR